jgi:secreted trypsin-like serine protease
LTSRTLLGQLTAVVVMASPMIVALQPAPAPASAPAPAPARTGTSATATGDPVAPMIIGGTDATENYGFTARLQTTYAGLGVARCTGTFVKNRRGRIGVATNAHCVSRMDSGQAMPADTVQVQAGSTHLDQLVTIPTTQVIVHPGWDWGTGGDAFDDVSIVNVTIPAGTHVTAIPISEWARANKPVRLLGWGKTTYDATEPPPLLQQLDTHITDRIACASAGITDGEICVAPAANGAQVCFGDSGGPALARHGSSWLLLGSASRVTDENTCTGPSVFTSASYYANWIDQALSNRCPTGRPRHVGARAAQRFWSLAG